MNASVSDLWPFRTVWVGPLVVKEMKRIVESSEIVKFVALPLVFTARPDTLLNIGKTTPTGRRRTLSASKNWRFGLGLTTSPSRLAYASMSNRIPHINGRLFQTAKIGSLVDIQDSEDPEGLRVFYYLIQDLKVCLFMANCCPLST